MLQVLRCPQSKKKHTLQATDRCPKYRRVDDPLKSLGAAEASRILQKWYRSLYVNIWDMCQTQFIRKRRTSSFVLLVEVSGSVFWFKGADLASSYIATTSRLHPITRRELLPIEMYRVSKTLNKQTSVLFELTRKYEPQIRESLRNSMSLQCGLHTFAGEKLDAILTDAELDNCDPPEVYDTLYEYEDCIRRVARYCQLQSCLELLHLHKQQAQNRELHCDPFLWQTISESIENMLRRYTRHRSHNQPLPGLACWLREGV